MTGRGGHFGNLLIVQDEMGIEVVFKGDDCVKQFGSWLLDGTHTVPIILYVVAMIYTKIAISLNFFG